MKLTREICRMSSNEYDKYRVLDEGFDLFVDACREYIEFWGLLDWEVSYTFRESVSDDPVRARFICHDDLNRLAEFILYDSWDVEPNEWWLRKMAFHEVTHLFFLDFSLLTNPGAAGRVITIEDCNRVEHKIVRTLENRVWRPMHDHLLSKDEQCEGPEIFEMVDK